MKNMLNYYYHIYPLNIKLNNGYYLFEHNNNKYVFEKVKVPLADIEALYELNKEMIKKNILVHEIIKNKDDNILTYINNDAYLLMIININADCITKISDICYINNTSYNINFNKILNRNDWITLWESKIDHYEKTINEIGYNYPCLSAYTNYYIGLSENAILYAKKALLISDNTYLCAGHRRIDSNSSLFYLYHPLTFIYDYRIRDLSEYIKSCFYNKIDIIEVLEEYFSHNYITYKEALLFYARLLYPSFYFDICDEIINNNINENEIIKIVKRADEYENILNQINNYLSKLYYKPLPQIQWLTKKD